MAESEGCPDCARLREERDEARALVAQNEGRVKEIVDEHLVTRAESAEARVAELEGALSFDTLRRANDARNSSLFQGEDWSLTDWTLAAFGELGEAANLVKKIRRGDEGEGLADLREELGHEIADVVIYLDLLASAAGIDLGEVVAAKWNAVSERRGSELRIVQFLARRGEEGRRE